MELNSVEFGYDVTTSERETAYVDLKDGSTLQLVRFGHVYTLTLFRPLITSGLRPTEQWKNLDTLSAQAVLYEVTKDEAL
jgi:hypothetical protein